MRITIETAFAAVAAAAFLQCGAAMAQVDPTCDTYARTALQQADQGRAAGCGFAGPRWDATYQDHYNWCLGVSQAQRDGEAQARSDGLVQCGARADPACDTYARTALQQADQGRVAGCGFTGPRWEASYEDHYNWCLGVSQAQRDGETQARSDGLVQCGAAGGATGGGGGACADPRVLPIMDEWLRLAIPPQQSGESLYYDEWGRILGTSLTGTIRPAGNPDAPQGRCAWLLYLAPRLDSMNGYGTMQSYLEGRLQ
jgi:hypothetical protein